MITQIELEEMRFYAYHGVSPQERKVGNHFVVTLRPCSNMQPDASSVP